MKSMFKIQGTFPYILALFLNAFTDLGHKIIIQNTIFKIYDEQVMIMLTAVVNALILLPFILMFTPSGYLSDRFPKHTIMKYAALFAVVITLGITLSYYMGWFWAAFFFTFLLAAQSALYSPAKYGYIKELVGEKFISAGNAAVQSATTVAILSGIIFYTVLFESSLEATYADESEILRQIAPLGWLLVLGSLIEWYLASRLPDRHRKMAKNRFDLKRYRSGFYLRKNIKTMSRKRTILESIIALSIFWSVSQVILASFGAYAKAELGILNTIVVQGVMALAAIGIVIGSVTAAYFSKRYIHLGLVPFGAAGLALMILLLPFMGDIYAIAGLFLGFGFFAGMFIVPLNAYIQKTAPGVHLGTILAGNNFVQNIFMFTFLLLTTLFAYYGLDAEALFYLMFLIAGAMAFYMARKHLVMLIWFTGELLLRLRYKIVYIGEENVPKEGAVLLLGNHISWMDWIVSQFPLERRIRFVMERSIYEWKLINPLMRLGKAIPISSKGAKEAFMHAREHIAAKQMIGLYPEGSISHTGELGKFHRGFEIIAGTYNGKIIPYYIGGMWGSMLSRSKKRFVIQRSGLRRKVTVIYGEPMPLQSSADEVRAAIEKLKEQYGA
jgi:acyl-[acyl-carrier-protein]-phospholipid O-acyltransferase/long-chain-fatty-acid--[acyl-carrier-protein] ligase